MRRAGVFDDSGAHDIALIVEIIREAEMHAISVEVVKLINVYTVSIV